MPFLRQSFPGLTQQLQSNKINFEILSIITPQATADKPKSQSSARMPRGKKPIYFPVLTSRTVTGLRRRIS